MSLFPSLFPPNLPPSLLISCSSSSHSHFQSFSISPSLPLTAVERWIRMNEYLGHWTAQRSKHRQLLYKTRTHTRTHRVWSVAVWCWSETPTKIWSSQRHPSNPPPLHLPARSPYVIKGFTTKRVNAMRKKPVFLAAVYLVTHRVWRTKRLQSLYFSYRKVERPLNKDPYHLLSEIKADDASTLFSLCVVKG